MGCGAATAKTSHQHKYAADAVREIAKCSIYGDTISDGENTNCRVRSPKTHDSQYGSVKAEPLEHDQLNCAASQPAQACEPDAVLELDSSTGFVGAHITSADIRNQPRLDEQASPIKDTRRWLEGEAGLRARANALADIFRQYENDAVLDVASQDIDSRMPLVTPNNMIALAHVLDVDFQHEPFLVLVCKNLLGGALAKAYRNHQALGPQDAEQALKVLNDERRNLTKKHSAHDHGQSVAGFAQCVECSSEAVCYCVDCEDTFCNACFLKLHAKGNRAKHIQLDVHMAGFKVSQKAGAWSGLTVTAKGELESSAYSVHSTLRAHTKWHPFTDSCGLTYFYNFSTAKMTRHPPQDSLEDMARVRPPPLP